MNSKKHIQTLISLAASLMTLSLTQLGCIGCKHIDTRGDAVVANLESSISASAATTEAPYYPVNWIASERVIDLSNGRPTSRTYSDISVYESVVHETNGCVYHVTLKVGTEGLRTRLAGLNEDLNSMEGNEIASGSTVATEYNLELMLKSSPSGVNCGITIGHPRYYNLTSTLTVLEFQNQHSVVEARTYSDLNSVNDYFLKGRAHSTFSNTLIGDVDFTVDFKLTTTNMVLSSTTDGDCS